MNFEKTWIHEDVSVSSIMKSLQNKHYSLYIYDIVKEIFIYSQPDNYLYIDDDLIKLTYEF